MAISVQAATSRSSIAPASWSPEQRFRGQSGQRLTAEATLREIPEAARVRRSAIQILNQPLPAPVAAIAFHNKAAVYAIHRWHRCASPALSDRPRRAVPFFPTAESLHARAAIAALTTTLSPSKSHHDWFNPASMRSLRTANLRLIQNHATSPKPANSRSTSRNNSR